MIKILKRLLVVLMWTAMFISIFMFIPFIAGILYFVITGKDPAMDFFEWISKAHKWANA
tara:strand:+ start:562 stop:738 length:177 start_codon:yes stop_codon:yes gene_type:complete